jgi:CTP:molybdopterin cytidylyltransferase MocA
VATRAFPVGAVIVGAGAGTRFGEPKATALLPDGRRFLDAVCATALAAGCDPVIAVLPPDVEAPAGIQVVVNPRPESEQIASVRLGLARLSNTPCVGALLWPVDHPFVDLRSALAVLDGARRTGATIVLPRCGERRGHPAYFARDHWRELLTVADGGARAVIASHAATAGAVAEVAVEDRGVLRDIDRREDLAR